MRTAREQVRFRFGLRGLMGITAAVAVIVDAFRRLVIGDLFDTPHLSELFLLLYAFVAFAMIAVCDVLHLRHWSPRRIKQRIRSVAKRAARTRRQRPRTSFATPFAPIHTDFTR